MMRGMDRKKRAESRRNVAKATKATKAKRIGANRQKTLEEERAKRPQIIKSLLRRSFKVAAVLAIVAGVAYGVYSCGPQIVTGISTASLSNKMLYQNVTITNCKKQTELALLNAIDSIRNVDSTLFVRKEILRLAQRIPEIEKIRVRKVRSRTGKEEDATVINITERKPVALVHAGNISLVDKNGVRFTASQGEYYDLPLYVTSANRDTVDMEIFDRIKKISRGLAPTFFQEISQIDVSDSEYIYLYFKSGEAEYVIGYNDIEERLHHVKKLRERLLDGNIESAGRIDLRYRGLAFASDN